MTAANDWRIPLWFREWRARVYEESLALRRTAYMARWSAEPLIAWMRDNTPEPNGSSRENAITVLTLRLDVVRSTVYRWVERGLSDAHADRVATELGVHPSEIWPEYWDAVA